VLELVAGEGELDEDEDEDEEEDELHAPAKAAKSAKIATRRRGKTACRSAHPVMSRAFSRGYFPNVPNGPISALFLAVTLRISVDLWSLDNVSRRRERLRGGEPLCAPGPRGQGSVTDDDGEGPWDAERASELR
jgi:hypothetical protein